MANYKLSSDYWETSGIYDIGQGKTQREINNQIISDIQTESVFDKVPYAFRKTGGSVAVGKREMDKLVGGTVVWNQIVADGKVTSATYWEGNKGSISVTNNELTYSVTEAGSTTYDNRIQQRMSISIYDHVYLLECDHKESKANLKMSFTLVASSVGVYNKNTSTSWAHDYGIKKPDSTALGTGKWLAVRLYSGTDSIAIGDSITVKNLVCYDITQMFGSTIADYILALETAHAGDGYAFFKSLFPNSYYAYNAGTLMSVEAASHITRGFNQWDEEWEVGAYNGSTGIKAPSSDRIRSKNYMPALPNTQYYQTELLQIYFYDVNKNYITYYNSSSNYIFTTPENTAYFTFNRKASTGTTYNHDICINLSDPAKNGTYEPYNGHTYPLDSTLTLRGIPKLDSNNKLYYDGDIYESDGTVTRKYTVVDLGTLDWTYSSSGQVFISSTNSMSVRGKAGTQGGSNNVICSKYSARPTRAYSDSYADGQCGLSVDGGQLVIKDTSYNDASTFKAAMSGIYLIYEIATPTTESADPFTNPQICDGYGTEEYVDAAVLAEDRDVSIPVGHDTEYMTETASNAAGWDTDYAAMIAPTEKEFVATRAYSTNNLFIISGQIYKATGSIANGAAITVGTNCAPTTIGEILTALLNA